MAWYLFTRMHHLNTFLFLFSVLEKQEVQPHSSASGHHDSTVPFTACWKKADSWCRDGRIVQVRAYNKRSSKFNYSEITFVDIASPWLCNHNRTVARQNLFLEKKKTELSFVWVMSCFLTNESLACTVSQRNHCKRFQYCELYKSSQASTQIVSATFHQHKNQEVNETQSFV